MTIHLQIKKQEQLLARCEKSLALEKLNKRRADTRRKIELGGLVIKSGLFRYDKTIIMGALDYVFNLLEKQEFVILFEEKGKRLFK